LKEKSFLFDGSISSFKLDELSFLTIGNFLVSKLVG